MTASNVQSSDLRSTSTALVVGGGIAGIACAVRLAERGVGVTLLETRKKLGGRATSFRDVRTGEVLDNCQHVVLGCCTNYMDLLARLEVADRIRFHREQHWIEEGGRTSIVRRGGLPAPFHFGVSFLRAKFLSFTEASAIGRVCVRMLSVDRSAFGHMTFGAWLRRNGQSESVIRRFWAPVVVSACNLDVDRVAASSALHVFQEGFLAHPCAADLGVSTVPLVDLYEAAERLIGQSGGGRLMLGAGVERIERTDGRIIARTTGGQTYTADVVVCAVPVERVNRIVSDELQREDARFAGLDRFTHSPILGVHMRFDRGVLGDLPHAVLVDRPTQWLFRKNQDGSYVHAVISSADDWLPLSEAEVGERVAADIRACVPDARAAHLVSVRAVKEKLATFAPVPGLDALRPPPRPPSGDGLILAGDYTDTGWPATMEGATRSGYAAAAAALNEPRERFLVPSLSVAPISRWLGLAG